MTDGVWFNEENSTDTLKFISKDLDTIEEVKYILDSIYKMLDEKNEAYGDSALNPIRLFSRADAQAALRVRIDDKLSRIKNQGLDDNEDSIVDLIGYLVLLKVAMNEKRG